MTNDLPCHLNHGHDLADHQRRQLVFHFVGYFLYVAPFFV